MLKQELATCIRKYNEKGWSPATSTNYSFKENEQIFVSRSGIDKAHFHEDDFICVDQKGIPSAEFANSKPSAETLIHCVIYDLFPSTKVILHAHSLFAVLNSQKHDKEILFSGYEIQKGFKGQTTHNAEISIPIFPNSQDMEELTVQLIENKELLQHHCFIIKNHGTYAWGDTLFEAKRHLESLEYLLEINWNLMK